MLIRSTWTLTTDTAISVPKSYGLELGKSLHSRLAIALGDESIPSTTFSGILGPCTASREFVTFQPGEFYQLSLSGLQESSAKAIADLDLGEELHCLGATFRVVERQDQASSYEALYHELVAAEPEPKRQFDLTFATPTTFSQNQLYLPLPVPALMFRSWLERWNHFAPVYLGGDELIGYLGEAIALSRHRIQSQPFPVHKSYITGFMGTVSLRTLPRIDPLLANVAELLIRYSAWASTGTKVRLGMGQTTCLQPPIPNDNL
jgi:CRISPR-associated endoribonuclease Cas6